MCDVRELVIQKGVKISSIKRQVLVIRGYLPWKAAQARRRRRRVASGRAGAGVT